MSCTELHTGTLHKLPINTEEGIKTYLKNQLITKKPEKKEEILVLDDLQDIYDELYYADIHNDYYINYHKMEIYKIIDHKSYDDDDYIDDWEQLPDGDIKFITQFYNGGCCLDEVIESGLKRFNT